MQINYEATPTCARLHSSDKFIRGIKGPVGSGKSVGCLQELFRLACDQWPNSRNERLTRWAVIRNTSIELRTTTLNTFKQWFPEPLSSVTLSPYICATIELPLPDGTKVKTEFYFLALDRDDDVRKLLSLEVTGGFMNESRELSYAVLKALRERSGRYPARIDHYDDTETYKAPRDENGDIQPCKRKAIVMDTNPPDDEHWWYQLDVDGCLKKEADKAAAKKEVSRLFDFFNTPPPLLYADGKYEKNPAAENIKYLPKGYQYYFDMIGGNTWDHINVMVLGNYGTIRDGKPVYPEYNDAIHSSENLKGAEGFPICLGWDFGLTPSCIIGQMTDTGQVRILAELVTEDMHVRQFARDVVKPFLSRHFNNVDIGFSTADPSGTGRGDAEGKSPIGILNDEYVDDDEFNDVPLEMGFETVPATVNGQPCNDPSTRLDAVKSFLIRMVGSGEPGIIIRRGTCSTIRKGFQGQYRYKKVQTAGKTEVYHDKPVKDKFSHPHDALQYLCMGFKGGYNPVKDDDSMYDGHTYEIPEEYW